MSNPFANTIKFLSVISLLASPSGTTIQQMMKNLAISRRTSFRLLGALEELGFPLIDEKSKSRSEKIYRLMDCYVLKLPNIAIPNPGFTEPETEMLLSIIDFCSDLHRSDGTILLNGIRQKVNAMRKKDKGQRKC